MHTITDDTQARMPDGGRNIRKRRDPREHDYAVLALIMRHQVEADGIKEPQISAMFDISDSKLREIIRRLRRSGYPEICSGNTGYYFSLADAQRTAASLKKRGLNIVTTASIMLKELSHKSQISAFEQTSGSTLGDIDSLPKAAAGYESGSGESIGKESIVGDLLPLQIPIQPVAGPIIHVEKRK
jgi:hypothetical protein